MGTHTASRDERGASAVEYGLLIAGVAAMIVLLIIAFTGSVTDLFGNSCDSIGSAAGNGANC
jgi:pilus assembly protein Flp/PilA